MPVVVDSVRDLFVSVSFLSCFERALWDLTMLFTSSKQGNKLGLDKTPERVDTVAFTVRTHAR